MTDETNLKEEVLSEKDEQYDGNDNNDNSVSNDIDMADEEVIEQKDDVEEEDDDNQPPLDDIEDLDDDAFLDYINSKENTLKPKKEEQIEEDSVKPNQAKIISKPENKIQENKEEKKEVKKVKEDISPINYEEAYKKIFSSFKANGKTITPKTVEDVISLMQMGANYTKKMQLLAPAKRSIETLNRADIKEEDLSFLIDIHKGDKEAIKKLLEKHKIDPMDLDLETINYASNTKNIASDADVEFTDTLQDINASLPKIQEILTKVWDTESKTKLLSNPALLKGLHQEIEMGRFDTVQAKLEHEKTFGRYRGVSDIDAYIDIVTKMVSQEYRHSHKDEDTPQVEAIKRTSEKAKAAPIRNKPKANHGTSLTISDLFSMSDAEFEKLQHKDLI